MGKNIDYMMEMVKDYLEGKLPGTYSSWIFRLRF